MLNQYIIIQTPPEDIVPMVSVVITAIVSILVTYITITNNTKTIFILENKDKINSIILELAKGARREKLDEINNVLNSKDNYYIPNDLKKKIKREIEIENSQWYSFYGLLKWKAKTIKYFENEEYPPVEERILKIINKYLSP